MSDDLGKLPPSPRQVWLTVAVVGMFLLVVTILAVLNLLTGELLSALVMILKLALQA